MRPYSVLITGASGGIGSVIARTFAAHPTIPFNLTLQGRKESANKLLDLAYTLPRRHSGQKHCVLPGKCWDEAFWVGLKWQEGNGAEVEDEESNDTMEQATLAGPSGEGPAYPVPWILVNAAGTAQTSLFHQMEAEAMSEVIDVNLLGTMYACKAFASKNLLRWRKKRINKEKQHTKDMGQERFVTPNIINVSSLLGTHGGSGAVAYATSKAGILGLSRALAAEYGRLGIRVNTLVPGYIDSPMTRSEPEHVMRRVQNNVPLRRLGTPEEVAEAAMFLALNNYANCCALNLDGGLSAVGGSE